jgi:hypothetical protein
VAKTSRAIWQIRKNASDILVASIAAIDFNEAKSCALLLRQFDPIGEVFPRLYRRHRSDAVATKEEIAKGHREGLWHQRLQVPSL